MTLLQALLLGILQGATEFVPVSSSGHLVWVPWLFGWPDPGLGFDATVHLGTFIAVVLYFRSDVVALVKGWFASVRRGSIRTAPERLAWLVIVSAVPGAAAGFFLEDPIERLFGSPVAVASLLIVTGAMLYLSDLLVRGPGEDGVRLPHALLMGAAQALAIAPGISRSGATISAGLVAGLSRPSATRFSFLMGIPLIAGASASQVYEAVRGGIGTAETMTLVVGFLVALVSGCVAIRFLLRFVQTHTLRPFAYYCWAVGGVGLVLMLAM